MSNNFEDALQRQEIPQFFRGQGPYFTRDPDWGDHLFSINWTDIFLYVRDHAEGEQQLREGFELYVHSLEETLDDGFSLRENLFGYYATRLRRAPDGPDWLAELSPLCRRRIVQHLTWYRWQLETQWQLYPNRGQRMREAGCPPEFLDLKSSPYH